MAWAWKVSQLLTLVALLPYHIAAEDDDEETAYSEAVANSEEATGSDDIGSAQTPSSVYVMEHGVLGAEWMPRGTMMLSGHGAGYEARLSDAEEFVQMKPQLQQMPPGHDLYFSELVLSLFVSARVVLGYSGRRIKLRCHVLWAAQDFQGSRRREVLCHSHVQSSKSQADLASSHPNEAPC